MSKTLWTRERHDNGEVTSVTYAEVLSFLCHIGGATRREARNQMRMAIRRQITGITAENCTFRHSLRARYVGFSPSDVGIG